MSPSCIDTSGGPMPRRTGNAVSTANVLALAAAPTFALMALLSGMGPADMLCSASASPFSGMATMYLLMSAFHIAPWLRLIRAWKRGAA